MFPQTKRSSLKQSNIKEESKTLWLCSRVPLFFFASNHSDDEHQLQAFRKPKAFEDKQLQTPHITAKGPNVAHVSNITLIIKE